MDVEDSGKKNNTNTIERTIIFFDWDDTLQPSSVLCSNQITLQTPVIPKNFELQFISLQEQIIKLIEVAQKYTKYIFIITNAEVLFEFLQYFYFL
jgi:hypothetical protein